MAQIFKLNQSWITEAPKAKGATKTATATSTASTSASIVTVATTSALLVYVYYCTLALNSHDRYIFCSSMLHSQGKILLETN